MVPVRLAELVCPNRSTEAILINYVFDNGNVRVMSKYTSNASLGSGGCLCPT